MTKPAQTIALLGTGSDVGKSVVASALCRIYRNRGYKVAPYKAQNMSNNSYVTREGGEMGRAQVVQAEACRLEPHTDMNPVLLKPNTDLGSQVVLQGKTIGNAQARDYYKDTSVLFAKARESLDRLRSRHELIVIEGAGSCAEVNLRSRDFVNFETAHAADAPVIIVADIDRGGVFAQLVGSLNVMPARDRQRVAGFIINKFRGDAALFDDGIRYLETTTGLPVLGLIPYYRHIEIDPEDGMPLETVIDPPDRPQPGKINIAAIRLPHISNFTDFNPLIRHPAIRFHYLSKPRDLSGYDLLILPGTKNVRFDLQWLCDTAWEAPIATFHNQGGRILGVCGGYQMLGHQIHDPHGVEGTPGSTPGLGLLDVATTLARDKILSRSQGKLADGTPIDGYEIHMGQTTLGPQAQPFVKISSRNAQPQTDTDGARNPDGTVIGCYFHGLFDFPEFRDHFLKQIDTDWTAEDRATAAAFKQTQYDQLADHFAQHLDMHKLDAILGLRKPSPKKHITMAPIAHQHGGNAQAMFERLQIAPQPLTDFSVNISPLGPPDVVRQRWDEMLSHLDHYPSTNGHGIRDFYQHRFKLPASCVLPGNGSIDLIYTIPSVRGLKTAYVPQPSFFDYREALRLAGCQMLDHPPKSFNAVDAIWIGNPNNPDGKLIPKEALLAQADAYPDTLFIVDEAFVQFLPHADEQTLMHPDRLRPNLIVLHSLTKTYALPGLRLGACISHPDTIAHLAAHRPPWMVNAIAENIARELAHCRDYEKSLVQGITTERKRMLNELQTMAKFSVESGATANFILAYWQGSDDLDDLLRHLLQKGCFVRDCRNFRGLPHNAFRIGLRLPQDNNKLLKAMASC